MGKGARAEKVVDTHQVPEDVQAAALAGLQEGKELTVQGVASLPPEVRSKYLKPGDTVEFNRIGQAYIVIRSHP